MPEDKWQRILNDGKKRQSAEQKLDGWLVKPTDGIFARTNRRCLHTDQPANHPLPDHTEHGQPVHAGSELCRWVFLALGGYWNMLSGRGAWGWLSSVPDGCDGEVARLKLQESAFGCWLETMCDNLYYVFIFAGFYDRARENHRQPKLSAMGWSPAVRRDCQFPHYRTSATPVGQRKSRTVFESVAQRSRQPQFEPFPVSRATY